MMTNKELKEAIRNLDSDMRLIEFPPKSFTMTEILLAIVERLEKLEESHKEHIHPFYEGGINGERRFTGPAK